MPQDAVAACVGAICQQDERLLLVRRGHGAAGGTWHAPTVTIGAGETAAEAVVRACEGLTGLAVLCGPFVGWTEDPLGEPPSVTIYFDAVPLDRDATPVAPVGETSLDGDAAPAGRGVAEARFVDLWEVPELRLGDGLAEFLADSGIIDLVV